MGYSREKAALAADAIDGKLPLTLNFGSNNPQLQCLICSLDVLTVLIPYLEDASVLLEAKSKAVKKYVEVSIS